MHSTSLSPKGSTQENAKRSSTQPKSALRIIKAADAPKPDEFSELKHARLRNWGRYSREGYSGPRGIHSGLQGYIHDDADKEGWGEQSVDSIPPPINHRDGEYLDGFIHQMPVHHRKYIKTRYYEHLYVNGLDLDTAIRCLLDMLRENRATVAKMRRLTGQ